MEQQIKDPLGFEKIGERVTSADLGVMTHHNHEGKDEDNNNNGSNNASTSLLNVKNGINKNNKWEITKREDVENVGYGAQNVLGLVGRKRPSSYSKNKTGDNDGNKNTGNTASPNSSSSSNTNEETEVMNLGEVLIDWIGTAATKRFNADVCYSTSTSPPVCCSLCLHTMLHSTLSYIRPFDIYLFHLHFAHFH